MRQFVDKNKMTEAKGS